MLVYTSKIKFKLIELLFRSGRFRPEVGLEPGNARSVGKRLTHWATGASFHSRSPNVGETFFVLQAHGLFVPSFQTLESDYHSVLYRFTLFVSFFSMTQSKSDCESFYLRFLVRWIFSGGGGGGQCWVSRANCTTREAEDVKRFIRLRGLRQ